MRRAVGITSGGWTLTKINTFNYSCVLIWKKEKKNPSPIVTCLTKVFPAKTAAWQQSESLTVFGHAAECSLWLCRRDNIGINQLMHFILKLCQYSHFLFSCVHTKCGNHVVITSNVNVPLHCNEDTKTYSRKNVKILHFVLWQSIEMTLNPHWQYLQQHTVAVAPYAKRWLDWDPVNVEAIEVQWTQETNLRWLELCDMVHFPNGIGHQKTVHCCHKDMYSICFTIIQM